MKKINLLLLFFVFQFSSYGQLPNCIKDKCDAILKKELGKDIFNQCVEFDFYKCDRPRLLLTEDTCATVDRQDYLVKYTFRFPNEENAKFSLGFDCDIYNGEIHIQSEYFTRKDQSDLPVGFAQNGLEIVDYSSILKKARKKDPKAVRYGGELALDQDALYWVFSAVIPINNPDGDAEIGVQHTVYLDPYTGKVVSHGVRAY